jgi:hypothetical protein
MVPAARLELAQHIRRRILSPLCLPIPPRGLSLACPEGLEPPTQSLEGSCSNPAELRTVNL